MTDINSISQSAKQEMLKDPINMQLNKEVHKLTTYLVKTFKITPAQIKVEKDKLDKFKVL